MRRREALGSIAAVGLTAGCQAILSTPCEPGDRELGALHDEVLDGANPGEVSIRATVLRVQTTSLVVGDGTGYARVNAPFGWEFNDTLVDPEECVTVDGEVNTGFSREYGYLDVDVGGEEDLDFGSDTEDPPDPPPSEPDAFFDVSFVDGGVELTHDGSDAVPASDLEVRHQPGGDFAIYPWPEFAGVDPDTDVGPGDSAVFSRSGNGHLVWRPEEYWGDAVSSGWEL